MVEPERANRKKQDIDRKQHSRPQKSFPSREHPEPHPSGEAPLTETPYKPRINEHHELLAMAKSDDRRVNTVLQLQQAYGNRYLQRLMRSMPVQNKLTLSTPNDVKEQAADRVSEIVNHQINSRIQRQGEEEEIQTRSVLQNQPGAPTPGVNSKIESRKKAAGPSGEYLREGTRASMEQTSGADFNERAVAPKIIRRKETIHRKTVKELTEYHEQQIKNAGGIKQSTKTGKKEAEIKKTPQAETKSGTKSAIDKQAETKKTSPTVPVRWYKIWSETEKERQKHWQPLISLMNDLLASGGKPGWWARTTLLGLKKKSPYARILEEVNEYHNRAIKCHREMEMTPDDFRFQLEALDQIENLIGTWNKKYDSWKPKSREARKGRKEVLDRLEDEIKTEKSERLEALRPWVTHKTIIVNKEGGKAKGGSALERLDPEHREAIVLSALYPEWQASGSKLEFFDWVTKLEKEKSDTILMSIWLKEKLSPMKQITSEERKAKAEQMLADPGKYKYPGWKNTFLSQIKSEKFIERIQYVNKDQRDRFLLAFEGARAFYAKRGNLKPLTKKCIYVMSPEGKFYAGEEKDEKAKDLIYHHSSFLGGAAVGAAGVIDISGSQINLDIESGHYRPTTQHIVNAINGMEKNGVPLKNLNVRPLFENKWMSNADDFMKGMKALQKGQGMKHPDVERMLIRYFSSLDETLTEELKDQHVKELRKIAKELIF